METTNKKLTLGFIGNGKSANRYHIPYILRRPERIRLKTIWQRRAGNGPWAAVPFVEYTTDLDGMLADPEIDAVVVSTPAQAHYELAAKALEAGKHCVVEKPFTETPEQAEELFRLAEWKGLVIEAYQNRRFDSDFLTVQKVVESGKLGGLLEMELHFDYYRPEVPESQQEFTFNNSFLYGHACHTLDQVISYFGKPERVVYDVRQLLGKGRMNDYFDLDLFYADNLKISVKSSYFRVKQRPSFVVYGKRGCFVKETKDRQEEHLKLFYRPGQPGFGLVLPERYGVLTWYDENGGFHEEKVPSVPGDYGRYYDALYETILGGGEKLVKDEETLEQIRIMSEGIRRMNML